jgi:ribosomal protein RSM22 (predicted rRNA methylase)
VAKSQRTPLPELPLSAGFYQAVARVAQRAGQPLADRAALVRAVAELSALYTRERDGLALGTLQSSAPLARLGFFLPRDMIKVFGPLAELARAGRLPSRPTLRVLDLGAGLGATSLGVARFLRHAGSAAVRLQVTAVERDAGSLQLMRALVEALHPLADELVPIELELARADVARELPQGSFDLVLLGFVLNELYLDRPAESRPALRAALLQELAARLAPDGALIVLEPALKESARELMRTRDALVASASALHVFAPCVHREPCPMLVRERDWCHESLDYALPEPLAEVARAAGLRFEGLSYAALVLTRQPRFADLRPRQRIVSDPLPSKGKLELFGCSQEGYQRLVRLDRERSRENAAFDELRRGDVVELAGTRVTKETSLKKGSSPI